MTSISKSTTNKPGTYYHPFYINGGIQSFTSLNITDNICSSESVYFYTASYSSSMNFTSFSRNRLTSGNNLHFYAGGTTFLKYSNFYNNSGTQLIRFQYYSNIFSCFFYNNIAFSEKLIQFENSYAHSISNSYFDFPNFTGTIPSTTSIYTFSSTFQYLVGNKMCDNPILPDNSYDRYYSNPITIFLINQPNRQTGTFPHFVVGFSTFINLKTYGSKNIGSGGAISIYDTNTELLLESCLFNLCTCLFYGGAIYFNCNTTGSIVIEKTCGISCTSQHLGHFIYSITYNEKINTMNLVTISSCSTDFSIGSASIYLNQGDQWIRSLNSSLNKAKEQSGIYSIKPKTISFAFTTFLNDTSSIRSCIFIYQGMTMNEMQYCNIIGNECPITGSIFLQTDSDNTVIKDSILQDNSKTLFFRRNGLMNIVNCWIEGHLVVLGAILTEQKQKTNTLLFTHYASYLCHTNDPIPHRTAEATPDPTPYQTIPPPPTPPQTLYPEPTPIQSFYPEPSPVRTIYPDPSPPQTLPICPPTSNLNELTFKINDIFSLLLISIIIN